MIIKENQSVKALDLLAPRGKAKVDSTAKNAPFSEILGEEQKICPYSHLDVGGYIKYNGVVFVCDYRTNSICLGDMQNPKKVLRIILPSGGKLNVNEDNFEDLSKVTSMFTPEDLNAIMRAIAHYNFSKKKFDELDENEIKTLKNMINEADTWAEASDIRKKETGR